MDIDKHVVFRSQLVEVLYSRHSLLRVVFPEIDFDALDAPTLPPLQGCFHLVVREVLTVDES